GLGDSPIKLDVPLALFLGLVEPTIEDGELDIKLDGSDAELLESIQVQEGEVEELGLEEFFAQVGIGRGEGGAEGRGVRATSGRLNFPNEGIEVCLQLGIEVCIF
ncbi:MAG: hypothetical protein ACRDIB_08230, partial [Ardenticatenaceae bacterium]